MTAPPIREIRYAWLLALLACCAPLCNLAAPIPVRYVEGVEHGFLSLSTEDGKIVAVGDLLQRVHGDRVTSHLTFRFKDGSIDDETTTFNQRGNFRLISDRHIQKGPAFPHPLDLAIDVASGNVTVRTTGKDGNEVAKTEHLDLPADLYNGLITSIAKNVVSTSPETKVSMLVATPKPRLIKLAITPAGKETVSIAGFPRQAIKYEIKLELGGVAGIVAPLVGKQPPNVQIWIVGAQLPTFLRERGPLYEESAIYTILLVGPTWPKARRTE